MTRARQEIIKFVEQSGIAEQKFNSKLKEFDAFTFAGHKIIKKGKEYVIN